MKIHWAFKVTAITKQQLFILNAFFGNRSRADAILYHLLSMDVDIEKQVCVFTGMSLVLIDAFDRSMSLYSPHISLVQQDM